MMQITLKYTSFGSDIAFLQIKQTEVTEIPYYLTFFYIHVCCSIFALLAGFSQFNNYILSKQTTIHRNIGKLYVFVILFFAAPSGFVIGLHANGGFYSQMAFVLLSIFWFYFTYKGFIKIKNRDVISHKIFMFRSFALTLSAITLRMWKVILVYLFQPSPIDLYQIIAWLGWIPNLLIIEYYIYKKFKK
jgi:uncharacterized membrane protein